MQPSLILSTDSFPGSISWPHLLYSVDYMPVDTACSPFIIDIASTNLLELISFQNKSTGQRQHRDSMSLLTVCTLLLSCPYQWRDNESKSASFFLLIKNE